MPPAAVRQLMQAFGNCNQPLEHRGPISINASPRRLESGPGFYGEGSWSPTQFSDLTDAAGIFNNNAFIDSTSKNNFFSGDNFLFNNNAEFITNNFPTTVVLGQPGTPGEPGELGAAGRSGLFVIAGTDGQQGEAGPAGQPGNDGLPGPPGAIGFFGIGGGYTLVRGGLKLVPLKGVLRDSIKSLPVPVQVPVPTWKFDSESCEVVPTGDTENVEITVKADVRIIGNPSLILENPPTLAAKPFYP